MKMSALLAVHDHRCVYCGRHVVNDFNVAPISRATKDHDIPVSRLKRLTPPGMTNEVLACAACNHAKSDMTGAEFVFFLKTERFAESYIRHLEEKVAKQLGERNRIPREASGTATTMAPSGPL